ncbi:MAG: cytochrome c [Burkholderiaceae bacterium]|jgi:cytochrome c556|nr:cytochrome c [Burkholderiaceae bacterium]
MSKLVPLALSAVCAAAFALPASAQFAKPEDAVKYRQAAFTLVGNHFGHLHAMIDGKVPYDAKVAAEDANVIDTVGKLPWHAFGPGTDKGETRAKPEVWKDQAKFKEALEKAQAELPKFIAAAKSGSLDNLKAGFNSMARTCKGCHDDFRKE